MQTGLPQLSPVGWLVFLLALYFVSKTKVGHALIYMVLLLVLVFLVLSNYKQINRAIVVQGS